MPSTVSAPPDRNGQRLDRLAAEVSECRRCPRLVAWREQVAREKRAAFRDQEYWGRPVPGFGDPAARLLILGLAPAAHGGNRTGRIFTGDRSGDWLFASLHRTGFANQPTSVSRDDGLALTDCYITAPVKCAPPDNKPLPAERDTCAPWLTAELALLDLDVVVALGAFAWDQALRHLGPVRPKPRFTHAAEAPLPHNRVLLGSYHVSQQNTSTRRLTADMLDAVFRRARELLEGEPGLDGLAGRVEPDHAARDSSSRERGTAACERVRVRPASSPRAPPQPARPGRGRDREDVVLRPPRHLVVARRATARVGAE